MLETFQQNLLKEMHLFIYFVEALTRDLTM